MKEYTIEILDDKVVNEIEEIAKLNKVSPEYLIALFTIKAVAPWHKLSKQVEKEEGHEG